MIHQRRIVNVKIRGGIRAVGHGEQARGGVVTAGGGSEDGRWRIEDGELGAPEQAVVKVGHADWQMLNVKM